MGLCAAGIGSGIVLGLIFVKKGRWKEMRTAVLVLVLFCMLGMIQGITQYTAEDGNLKLTRREPGKGEFETEVQASLPERETEYGFTLNIPERSYSSEEEKSLIAAARAEIDSTFCGANVSFEEIIENPIIREAYQEEAVSAEWDFLDSDWISETGEIDQEALRGKKQLTEAMVKLRCGEREEYYGFSFLILPREKSEEEHLAAEVQRAIDKQDSTRAQIELPRKMGGTDIQWKEEEEKKPQEIFFLGTAAAMAVYYVQKEEKEKKRQKRKRRLFLEYPEFVSKLSLMLGSGMHIPGAFRRMNALYLSRKKEGKQESPVYEELYRMVCEMENGMSEMRAYRNFSQRCELQPYRKLVSILLSSQKLGNRRLLESLNEEADRVFLERKNTARKLGEEAGTRLLLPMMIMLVIVMGIVLIPAFLSIYQL